VKLNTSIAIAAALVAGCTVHNDERSFIVGTKIIAATAGSAATDPCVYNVATNEGAFGAFDPAFGYVHAVVVQNQLPDNGGLGPGRINTNDFQVEGATITTDVLIGPAKSIASQTVPANGLIRVNAFAPVAVTMAQPGAIDPGTTVRFNVQVFGHLLDGSSAKSNRYEYAAAAIAGFTPAVPTCAAGLAPTGCEGLHQDTTVVCR
jgi:hypothetical protein